MAEEQDFRSKKVISIGVVKELTGLSERQIRYYEERKLVFPARTGGGSRKYSFNDIEQLIKIAEKLEDGVPTYEIRQEMVREKRKSDEQVHKKMIQGQLNAHFGVKNTKGP